MERNAQLAKFDDSKGRDLEGSSVLIKELKQTNLENKKQQQKNHDLTNMLHSTNQML